MAIVQMLVDSVKASAEEDDSSAAVASFVNARDGDGATTAPSTPPAVYVQRNDERFKIENDMLVRLDGDGASAKEVPSTFVLPLLDAFNHLSERGGATKLCFDKASNAFTLRAARDMRVGDEATISYGPRPNAYLLLRFGFAVFDSPDEFVSLPGCADELEWLMPGSAREADLYAENLHHAVRNARLDRDWKANTNLLWALRVLLASDEEYERVGGAKGFRGNISALHK